MKLLIIRHGQSEGDILNLQEGRADYSLTETGHLQAEKLAAFLKDNYRISRIYSSPMKRASAVAETVANVCGAVIEYDDDLKEYDNGLLAGLSFDYARTRYPEKNVAYSESIYEKESMKDFSERTLSVLKKIISKSKEDETVAVITHGGVISQFYKCQLKLPDSSKVFFYSGDTGIHEWMISENSTLILKSNFTSHLDDEVIRMESDSKKLNVSYFAGGCFWCITPIFKMYGAYKSLCGYSGGDEVNPCYEDVKKQKTSHRETIAVEYCSEKVSYENLVDIFLANVDPFDKDGQFIDKGHSYTLAIYYTNEEEKLVAERKVSELQAKTGKQVYIAIEKLKNFYEAEEYHQDYYLKNPDAFEKELRESGRKA